jgi:hypothetical protein
MIKPTLNSPIGMQIARLLARRATISPGNCVRKAEELDKRGITLRFGKRIIAHQEPDELVKFVIDKGGSVQLLGSVVQAIAEIPAAEISGA